MNMAARLAWDAVARLLPTPGLEALADAAGRDYPALMQGGYVNHDSADWDGTISDWTRLPCRGACLLGYPWWKGEGLASCARVMDRFDYTVERAADVLGDYEGNMVWALIEWWDTAPRDEALATIAALARAELAQRAARAADVPVIVTEGGHDAETGAAV